MLLQFIILITWQNYKDLWISSYTLLPEKGLLMNIFCVTNIGREVSMNQKFEADIIKLDMTM